MPKTEMIFACQTGSQLGHQRPIGLLWGQHCCIIATRETGDCEEGFRALWDALGDVEEFFEALRWQEMNDPGLWYMAAEYDQDDVDEDDLKSWEHLADKNPMHFSEIDSQALLADIMKDTEDPNAKHPYHNKWRWL